MFSQNFWNRKKKSIFVLILVLTPFLPLIYHRLKLPRVHLYEKISTGVVHPTADLIQSTGRGVSFLWSSYISLVNVKKENRLLKKELNDKTQQILALQEMERENSRLKKLLDFKENSKGDFVGARVIGHSPRSEHLSFIVDAGRNKGIRPRQAVLTSEGIVGTVKEVYPYSALVLSLLDPSHTVDAISEKTRSKMLIRGLGRPLQAKILYLDRAEEVKVGDNILSSGLDGVFPKGLPIGTIIKVKKPSFGVLQEAYMRAHISMSQVEEVLILNRSTEGSPL